MATPAIQNIIKTYPDAKITLLGSFVSTQAFENYPNIEKVIVDNTKKMETDIKFNIFSKKYWKS